jgi:hypothetical protein
MTKIFLSYSSLDAEIVVALERELGGAGFTVWRDQSRLRGGAKYGDEIRAAIDGADCVLICLSPNAVRSNWVLTEARRANELKKALPVTLLPCELDEYFRAEFARTHLRDIHAWVRARDRSAWSMLCDDIRAFSAGASSVEPTTLSAPGERFPIAPVHATAVNINISHAEGAIQAGHVAGNLTVVRHG